MHRKNLKHLDLIRMIIDSEKRFLILSFLNERPHTLRELREKTNSSSQVLIPQLNKLSEKNLIFRKDREYVITEDGRILISSIVNSVENLQTFDEFYEFWTTHDLSPIPNFLLKRIWELKNSKILGLPPTNFFQPRREFIENVLNTQKFYGISCVYHPKYSELCIELLNKGREIKLILPEGIVARISKEYYEVVYEGISSRLLELYARHNLKLSCVLTDRYFSISLFYKNGEYDHSKALVSIDSTAIFWGENLLSYYFRNSIKVTPKMIKKYAKDRATISY